MTEQDMAIAITKHDGQIERLEGRIKAVETEQSALRELAASVSSVVNELTHIKEDMHEVKADIKVLTEKPGKKWETLAAQVVSILVAAVLGFVIAKIGL